MNDVVISVETAKKYIDHLEGQLDILRTEQKERIDNPEPWATEVIEKVEAWVGRRNENEIYILLAEKARQEKEVTYTQHYGFLGMKSKEIKEVIVTEKPIEDILDEEFGELPALHNGWYMPAFSAIRLMSKRAFPRNYWNYGGCDRFDTLDLCRFLRNCRIFVGDILTRDITNNQVCIQDKLKEMQNAIRHARVEGVCVSVKKLEEINQAIGGLK